MWQTKERIYADYEDRMAWAKKMLINISKAGFFSSDRTIAQYNEDIWQSVKPGKTARKKKLCFKIYIFLSQRGVPQRRSFLYENSGNRENAVQNPATGILYKVRGFFIIRKDRAAVWKTRRNSARKWRK